MTKKEYYKSLAEIQLIENHSIEDFMLPFNHLMIAKGVVIKMESDLIEFLKKSKPTDKSKEKQEQINLLHEAINYFLRVNDVSIQMQEVFKINAAWMEDLKKQNAELKTKLEDMDYFKNGLDNVNRG